MDGVLVQGEVDPRRFFVFMILFFLLIRSKIVVFFGRVFFCYCVLFLVSSRVHTLAMPRFRRCFHRFPKFSVARCVPREPNKGTACVMTSMESHSQSEYRCNEYGFNLKNMGDTMLLSVWARLGPVR